MTEGNDGVMTIETLLRLTDWTMTEPVDGSAFHLIVAVVGISTAIITAVAFAGKQRLAASKDKGYIDLIIGLVLLLSEIYKQLFRYFIVDGRHYRVEFVPFQLCSLPMYLCLINAWLMYRYDKLESGRDKYQKENLQKCEQILKHSNTHKNTYFIEKSNRYENKYVAGKKSEQHTKAITGKIICAINTFIIDFNLMGALMVFVEPSGIFSKYVVLTWHGILWHLLIIFLGVYKGLTCRNTHLSMRSFARTLPIFFAGCGIATILNIVLQPYGFISMFYISPYEPSIQIVFSDIAAKFGIAIGNIAYILAMLLGGFVFHSIFYCIQKVYFKRGQA